MKQIYLVLMALMATCSSFGQTLLLDPNAAGGFESGTTFAANGWTLVSSIQPNRWVVGTNSPGAAGQRAAYLSNDWAAANPALTLATGNGVSYYPKFFREITVPANQPALRLGFKWKSGNTTNTNFSLQVCIDTNGTVYSTSVWPATFAATYTFFNQNNNWSVANLSLPPYLAGRTFRLVFQVFNISNLTATASSVGHQVDSISLVSRAPINITSNTMVGNWQNANSWSPAIVPTAADTVTIRAFDSLSISDACTAAKLTVNGTLGVGSNVAYTMSVGGGGILVNSSGRFKTSDGVIFRTISSHGDVVLNAGAFVDWRNVSLLFDAPSQPQLFSFASAAQFVSGTLNDYLGNLHANCPGGLNIQTPGNALILAGRLNLLAGTVTHNNKIQFQPRAGLSPTIGVGNTGRLNVALPAVAGPYGLVYIHNNATPATPLVAGSRNELPASKSVRSFIVGSVSAYTRLTDTLTLTNSSTGTLQLFGTLSIDAGKAIIMDQPGATVQTFNNGHLNGAIIVTISSLGGTLNFPLGWGEVRRPLILSGLNSSNARIRAEVVPIAVNATTGTGISVMTRSFVRRLTLLSGTINSVNALQVGYDPIGDGLAVSELADRRLLVATVPAGPYNNATNTSATTTNQLTSNLASLPTDFYVNSGLASGNIANLITWTGNAGDSAWATAGNWSSNRTPDCNDSIAFSKPFFPIKMNNNARCAALFVAQFSGMTLNAGDSLFVGCNQPSGGKAMLDLGGRLFVSADSKLSVMGGIKARAGSWLSQTGGTIVLDPVGNTDTLASPALQLGETGQSLESISMNDGRLTIVDPNGFAAIDYRNQANYAASPMHTIELGNGSSTQTSRNFASFQLSLKDPVVNAYLRPGKLLINGGGSPGRFTHLPIDLTVGGMLEVSPNSSLSTDDGVRIYTAGGLMNRGNLFSNSAHLVVGNHNPSNGNFSVVATDTARITNTGRWGLPYFTRTPISVGSGYSVGDILTVVGGTFTSPTRYVVGSVSGAGSITSLLHYQAGDYTVDPPSPVTFTGGTGSGLSFQANYTMEDRFTRGGAFRTLVGRTGVIVLNNALALDSALNLFQNTKVHNPLGEITVGRENQYGSISGNAYTGTDAGWVSGTYHTVIGKNDLQRRPLPVGASTRQFVFAQSTATHAGSTPLVISATFYPSSMGTPPSPFTENGQTVSTISPEGYWRLSKTASGAPGGLHLAVAPTGFAQLNDNVTQNRLVFYTPPQFLWQQGTWSFLGSHLASNFPDSVFRQNVSWVNPVNMGIGRVQLALPTHLHSFTGRKTTGGNQLDWVAADERTTKVYELEASAETPTHFERIASSSPGFGRYQHLHSTSQGTWFYRLKMVNKDGLVQWSNVVRLSSGGAEQFAQLMPNRGHGQTTLQLQAQHNGQALVQVFDNRGQRVMTLSQQMAAGQQSISLDLSRLAAGIYQVHVACGEQIMTLPYQRW